MTIKTKRFIYNKKTNSELATFVFDIVLHGHTVAVYESFVPAAKL